MTRIGLVSFVAALGLVSVAAAASSQQLLTPKQVSAELTARHASVDLISTQGLIAGEPAWVANGNGTKERGNAFFGTITGATCVGLGKATKGAYATFKCSLTLSRSPSPGVASGTYWVRVWGASSTCASDRAIAACPPALPAHPLPSDPRLCSLKGVPVYCMLQAAEAAVLKNGRPTAGLGCQAVSSYVYRCTWGFPPPNIVSPGAATVSFVQGKTSWTTTVTNG